MSNIFHKEDFPKVLAKHGMILQEHQLRQFEEYASILTEWNQKINLTAITDPDKIYEKYSLDFILPSFDMSIQGSLCDVGAETGFPGISLKIIYPELELIIVGTLGKRITSLSALCDKLQLKGVTRVHERAEVYVEDHRESFDIVSVGVVANLPLLSELCIPLVKKQGSFLALKGANGDEEYALAEKVIRLLGCEMKQGGVYTLPNGSQQINFVPVKTRPTLKKYPRLFAQMKKNLL